MFIGKLYNIPFRSFLSAAVSVSVLVAVVDCFYFCNSHLNNAEKLLKRKSTLVIESLNENLQTFIAPQHI